MGEIKACDILDAARNPRSGQLIPRNVTIPSVDHLIVAIEEARRQRCGELTLGDLAKEEPSAPAVPAQEEPRPSLTLAKSRD
jgi:hypothetical protein